MDTISTNSCSSEGDSIKIFLRVRPPDPSISENDFAPRVLDVNTADNAVILRTKPEPKIFTYDNVADADIPQEAVFSVVGKKIIESCIAGYNGTIFAYGQTGSGKTFTMLGPSENSDSFQHELRGVIPRSFEYLFSLIAHQQELHGTKKQFLCKCSFLEIYQEQIFDLLDPTSQGLHLRENMNKGVFVDGLIEQVICNPRDAYQVLIMGWLNRRVAATSMNRESSRSHAVFTVTIESKEDVGGIQNLRTSQLNLVDLAGSERQRDTNTGGTRLKEAGSINKSLSVLGNVIMSLVDISHGKKRHIPYRDSKLTFLLRDSLGGNTKTRMIACVHPDSKCFGETLSTLNFARSAKLIKNKAVVNEDFHGNNQKLQNEIRRLKEMLEAVQQSPLHQSVSVVPKTPSLNLSSDSMWKRYFVEAMYFRDVSENEKRSLQDVVNHLQELCIKKDKYIQSAKMIIKFRENSIETLKQASISGTELDKDTYIKSLKDEIKVLRDQLENNPMLAKYAGENKYLRQELKMLRARIMLDEVHGDNVRITELERVFKELKMLKEMGSGSPSPNKEKIPPVIMEKHRQELKDYEEQVEALKKQILDISKVSENRQMELEVELVSCRKMITELERVLEAHQLKARIECNALKDLHCQTLKVMTTPKMSPKCESPAVQAGTGDAEMEDAYHDGSINSDLAKDAHDALMEEIHMLQMENGKYKERIDEYEADMLRLKQQVEKAEMYSQQINQVLERERADSNARRTDYTSAVSTLKEEIETVKNDLKLLNDENTDLHLVLKSADKQLKQEVEKHKATQELMSQQIQALETKITLSSLEVESTTRDYEEALKDLGVLKEEHELAQVTNSFLETQVQELSQMYSQECKAKKALEEKLQALNAAGDLKSYKDLKQQAEITISEKQAELEALLSEKETQDAILFEQKKQIQDNKEAISNLMLTLHDLKAQVNNSEEKVITLQMENENLSHDLRDLKRDQELTQGELSCVQREKLEEKDRFEALLLQKDFEIDNLQADQDSSNAHLLRQEEIINSLQAQLKTKEMLCKEYESNLGECKNKLAEAEKSYQSIMAHYQKTMREGIGSDNHHDAVKKLQDKSLEVESLSKDLMKMNNLMKEYEEARKQKNEENDMLKAQIHELEKSKISLNERLIQMEEKERASLSYKASNKELIKSMEKSLKSKEEELHKEHTNMKRIESLLTDRDIEMESLKEQAQALEWEKDHFMQEVTRLQSRLEANYNEKTELNSRMELLAEEKAKIASELQIERERNAQLMEESSRLIGHNNANQKIRLMEKKNQEYNELHKKYFELHEKYEKLMVETGKASIPSSSLPITPKGIKSELDKSGSSNSMTKGLREITNFN